MLHTDKESIVKAFIIVQHDRKEMIMKKRIVSFLMALTTAFVLLAPAAPALAAGENSFVAAGWYTTIFIKKDGSLWGYGKNDQNLLYNNSEAEVTEPVKLLDDVKNITVNRYAVLAVKKDNTLWYWGNVGGANKSKTPTKLLDDVLMVSVDETHSYPMIVLKTDGTVYFYENREFEAVPHSEKAKFVNTSGHNHYFITESNELWGWCTEKDGSSSLSIPGPVLTPQKIMDDVKFVTSSNSSTMFIRLDNTLWYVGDGSNGKVFDGTQEIGAVDTPIKIMDNVIYAAVQNGRHFAVKSDNSLWAWGNNSNRVLGGSHLAAPVKWTDGVTSVYVGGYGHILVTKTDHSLWASGTGQGIYGSPNSQVDLTLCATDIIDQPAAWALAEVREAEYRKLVPPDMQSDYTKIVTRSEFCTLAITCIEQTKQMTIENYLISRGMEVSGTSPFTDIGGLSDRAQADIQAAYALNIVNGTSASTFDPNNQITREQAAKMLTATAAALGESTTAQFPTFADSQEVSDWAKPYIGYVFNASIMTGVGNNNFSPKGGYQRQQAYMTMLRLYKQITN